MRAAALFAFLLSIVVVDTHGAAPGPQGRQARPTVQRPRLAVILVIDQMRADFIDRFGPDWTGGLKRLATEGAVFQNAAYPYLTTVTCAGHATISTGNFPHTHGIVQNAWWDPSVKAMRTCTEDPKARGIGYNAPSKEGDSAWRLQTPTFTDVLRSQRGARVVSLSLKARSAIMLGGHGGTAVTWLSESLDGWSTSSVFSEQPVPAVKQFVDANPIAADLGKTWERTLPAARYPEPDDAPGEAPPRGWTRTFPHVLNGVSNTRDAAFANQWERSPFADEYLGRFAASLVDALKLGQGEEDRTDVLCVSFSTPDLVSHAFGSDSQEVHDLYVRLDRTIGALLAHLDATVGRGRWIAALSADHGSTPVAEQLIARGKDAGHLDAKLIGAAIDARLRTALGEGQYVAQAYYNDIYLAPGVFDKMRADASLMNGVLETISAIPGIARVFRADELRDPASAGTDRVKRAAALTYFPGRSGDLIIAAKPGWEYIAAGASHGSANEDDQRVPLVFFGPSFKAGRYAEAATPADIAPTMAAALSVSMSKTEGHALSAALNHHQ